MQDSLITSVLVCVVALLLDRWLGEPGRWHPVVGLGRLATVLEQRLNRPPGSILRGGVAVVLLGTPAAGLAWWLSELLPQPLLWMMEAVVLWLALSLRGLEEHGEAVARALRQENLPEARVQVGRIVSRNAAELDESGVATAATESVLENGADAVFASLFWFLAAGLPGVVVHRVVNTLDAMWGYRNERFLRFGRFAARLDDVLNWIPARLTAITYALLGRTGRALACWRKQAVGWDSPNAGPVMAAGAGALGVALGGPAPYPEGVRVRPVLGYGPAPTGASVGRAMALVRLGTWLWLVLVFVVGLLINGGIG